MPFKNQDALTLRELHVIAREQGVPADIAQMFAQALFSRIGTICRRDDSGGLQPPAGEWSEQVDAIKASPDFAVYFGGVKSGDASSSGQGGASGATMSLEAALAAEIRERGLTLEEFQKLRPDKRLEIVAIARGAAPIVESWRKRAPIVSGVGASVDTTKMTPFERIEYANAQTLARAGIKDGGGRL
jgi:hypothetical protein